MKQLSVKLLDFTHPCAKFSAAAAKMSASRRSFEDALASQELPAWVTRVLVSGYTSVLEHCKYTFEIVCSRVCSHQLVRHRIASYTQQSMRWSEGFLRDLVIEACKLLGLECRPKPNHREDYFMYSKVIKMFREAFKNGSINMEEALTVINKAFVTPPNLSHDALRNVIDVYLSSVIRYYELLWAGVTKEDARYIIPASIKTRILVTMNARELFEVFLPLRLCRRAQWEIRAIAWGMLELLRRVEPEIWNYAGPRCLRLTQLTGKLCTMEEFLKERCEPRLCPEGVSPSEICSCVKKAMEVEKLVYTSLGRPATSSHATQLLTASSTASY